MTSKEKQNSAEPRRTSGLKRIVSGGQTGVDRAALEVAIELGIEQGGFCPRGRLAEDGPIPPQFQMTETQEAKYRTRTQLNVLHSDGTLILFRETIVGGTAATLLIAQNNEKPVFLADLEFPPTREAFLDWIVSQKIQVLNVAGSRESGAIGINEESKRLLRDWLA